MEDGFCSTGITTMKVMLAFFARVCYIGNILKERRRHHGTFETGTGGDSAPLRKGSEREKRVHPLYAKGIQERKRTAYKRTCVDWQV